MPRLKYVHIDNLIPTQPEIFIKRIRQIKGSPDNSLPEVWNINGGMYIADGHHHVFYQFLRNNNIIPIKYFTPLNTKSSPDAYLYLVEEIFNEAIKTERWGIKSLHQMVIR
jgi:hypothetical protein